MLSNLPAKHFVALDFYRYIAASGVVFLHFTEFGQYNQTTGIGGAVSDFAKFVDFFFILSGFVIGLTAFDDVGSPREIFNFLRRRIARIYPMHALTLALFLVPAILGASATGTKLNIGKLVGEILLVRYWQPHAELAYNFPSWSISSEWAMYLLFPGLVWACKRASLYPLVLLATLGIVAVELVLRFDPRYHGLWFLLNSPLRALPTFVSGIILSRVYDRFPIDKGVWLGVLLFFAAIVAMVFRWNGYLEIGLFGLSVWLTASGYAAGDRTIFDKYRIFRELGNASYSVYMLHVILLVILVQKIWPRSSLNQPPVTLGVAIILLTTIAAIACYHLFEKPMRDWISGRRSKVRLN